jgi:squalene-hopene/tetraprenyl-beta-curcumene cyclase
VARELAGWTFAETGCADVADTADAVRALARVRLPSGADGSAAGRAISWLESAQLADGGWDRHPGAGSRRLAGLASLSGLPDGAMRSSAAVTASAVHALAAAGLPGGRPVRRGIAWLLRAQRPDGAWPGLKGAGTTGADVVLPALIAAGVLPGKPVVRRALDWLARRQNADGGWPSVPGGPSSGPATVRALAAMIAAGGATDGISRGAAWLGRPGAADHDAPDPLALELTRLRAVAIRARAASLLAAGRS